MPWLIIQSGCLTIHRLVTVRSVNYSNIVRDRFRVRVTVSDMINVRVKVIAS